MKLYKVVFENDKPVSATEVDTANRCKEDDALLSVNDNTRWMLVLGFDEEDSINIARMVLDDDAT